MTMRIVTGGLWWHDKFTMSPQEHLSFMLMNVPLALPEQAGWPATMDAGQTPKRPFEHFQQ